MLTTIKSTNVPTGQPEPPESTIATPLGTTSTDNGKDYEDKEEETKSGAILCIYYQLICIINVKTNAHGYPSPLGSGFISCKLPLTLDSFHILVVYTY